MDGLSSTGYAISAAESKYYLSDRAHCCEFDDGAIILDMRAVTYLGIDAEHLPNLRARVANWPNSRQDEKMAATCTGTAAFKELIGDLLARGLLTTTPTKANSSEIECPTKAFTSTDWVATPRRIPFGHILHFCAALLWVLPRRKAGRLASLLRWIRSHQSAIHGDRQSFSGHIGGDLLGSFFRLRIWFYTAYRHCLLDSLVLSVFLTKQRVPCTLVIGVSTKPFAAHAWVQIGEYVLNDTVEHVQTFTPILEVGDLH
jgi:hypothetical protein